MMLTRQPCGHENLTESNQRRDRDEVPSDAMFAGGVVCWRHLQKSAVTPGTPNVIAGPVAAIVKGTEGFWHGLSPMTAWRLI